MAKTGEAKLITVESSAYEKLIANQKILLDALMNSGSHLYSLGVDVEEYDLIIREIKNEQ